MARLVNCVKLGVEAEGFERPPYPGEIGKRIYQCISKQAWQQWIGHQTMLINEYRLSTVDPKSREFLVQEMEKFLFGEGAQAPVGYVPPEES